ncbi:hypothetical protein CupriaWKF_12800 [Cupriavidus sp. WKF15]|uniref:hypothetical protein n=1 Tax=Cupriavidus sp. WKF15 TaxID=3032282 RepID=UPI0023E11230|nr:hypothetical protein [Cupriavidus sp. WKF15]WER45179.1 hypothetical protein CupriaWKF_12800 [Cupriavidus sp. WKF15]
MNPMNLVERKSAVAAKPSGGSWLLAVGAAFLTCLLLIPVGPLMPSAGLDPSWTFAVNEAIATGMVFGRDIIFTFGPYGSVYTHVFHPATEAMMLGGSALVALGLMSGFWLLAFPYRVAWLVFVPVAVGLCQLMDGIFLILPLLLLLAVFRLTNASDEREAVPSDGAARIAMALLAIAVGLLPLIKGSLGGFAGVAVGLSVVLCLVSGRVSQGIALVALVVASMVLGWVLSGQPIGALPGFFVSQKPIISGYTGAMSLEGDPSEVAIWLAAATAFVLALAGTLKGASRGRQACTLLGILFFVFVLFKAAFVRHDGHSLIAANALLFMTLIVLMTMRNRGALAVGAICLGASWMVNQSASGESLRETAGRLTGSIVSDVRALSSRLSGTKDLHAEYTRSNREILRNAHFRVLPGSADVYPTELAPLLASGQPWAGRPVPQSYSSYTGILLEKDARHLNGPSAPEHIYFTIAPIDGRLPSQDDSLSWPLLLSHYRIIDFNGIFLTLAREDGKLAQFGPERKQTTKDGESVIVADGTDLLWAKVDLRLTALGKLMLGLYKLPPVEIELTLHDGKMVTHRLIPDIARHGLLLSPYVSSAGDFLNVAGGGETRHVRSFRILTGKSVYWQRDIAVSTNELTISRQPDALKLLAVQPSQPLAPHSATCALDRIERREDGRIHAAGWITPSIDKGINPEKIWAVVQVGDGSVTTFQLPVSERPDVAAAFRKPVMDKTGFDTMVDVPSLNGELEFSVRAEAGGLLYECRNRATVK